MMGVSLKVFAKILALGIVVNLAMVSLSFGLKAAIEPGDDGIGTITDQKTDNEDTIIIVNGTFITITPEYLNFSMEDYYCFDIQRHFENQSRDEMALIHAEALNLTQVTGNHEPHIFPPYPYVNSTAPIPPNMTIQPTTILYHANITSMNALFNATAKYNEIHAPSAGPYYPALYVLDNGTWVDPGLTHTTLVPFLGWWIDVVYTYQYPAWMGWNTRLYLSIGVDPSMIPCFVSRLCIATN